MIKPRLRKLVGLTGGLGNQLFQFAILLSLNNNEEVGLVDGIGEPRRNREKLPEICSFNLETFNVHIIKKEFSWLTRKSLGFCLRMGVQPRRFEIAMFKKIARFASNFLLSITIHARLKLIIGRGVGYFNLKPSKSPLFLYGYFQSYYWASESETFKKLMELEPKKIGHELTSLISLAKIQKPLIVHVRLGDYLLEESFGIPSIDFYDKAISKIIRLTKSKYIWVFSDSIDSAKSYIPERFHSKITWMNEIDNSSAHTLQAMRLGSGYVIANSTFSWWAAFLRQNQFAPVIAPTPWFRNADDPALIIPPTWIRIPANF